MNCFLLLLLLNCCGWGNGCGCNSGRCCGTERRGCGMKREMPGRGCCSGMGPRRGDSCGRDGRRPECCEREEERRCGCEEEHRCGCEEERRCGCEEERRCGCEEEHRDHDGCGCRERENTCDGPGMIPPPWQDYPKFPRRDMGEDCDR